MADLEERWQNFADELEDFAIQKGIDEDEAKELATDYAERMQDLYDSFDAGELTQEEFDEAFYDDIYDSLLADYDIDIHDKGFYPKGE